MMRKILGLILLTPATLAQMDAVKPDISYSGNNERQVEPVVVARDHKRQSMMTAHNKKNRDIPLFDDDEEWAASDAQYRRKIPNEGTETLIDAFQRKQALNLFPIRRADDGFAEDDRFNSYEGGSVSQFEENLKKFTAKRKSTVNGDEEVTESSAVPSQNDASTVVDVTDVDVVVI